MTDHCNAYAARAVGSPFGFGAPFGLPPGMAPPHLSGMSGFEFAAAAAAAQADPNMAAFLRERAMMLGFGAGAPPGLSSQMPGFGGRLPPSMGPNPFGMPQPPVSAASGGMPQFWSSPKPPSGGPNESLNEQMYAMQQQQQWYAALAAANGGRLPPGAIPTPPQPNGVQQANQQLQFAAAQIAASNPQQWAAMAAAYGNNGNAPGSNGFAGFAPNHPNAAKMLSPTFLKTMQLEHEAAASHGKAPNSPRKENHIESTNGASQVATES